MRHPYVWLVCRLAARGEGTLDTRPVSERRAASQTPPNPAPPGDLVLRDHQVAVDGGTIRVRSYRPSGTELLPAQLLLHGGSFWSGSIETVDPLARLYAERARCVVVSVDYRLAPEHPWPAAVEDGYTALQWLVTNAAELGVDPTRLGVGGVSVGGGMAAVVAMMARDRGGPRLRFQLLEIPVTDLTGSSESMTTYASGYLCTRAALLEGYALYVPDPAQRSMPYASPLLAPDLTGLPPALVLTCEYDPLRDEGEALAARLREAGSPTELVRAKGHVHSSTYTQRLRSARGYQHRTADALRAALHGS
ncbi:alpha/beta hydrolase [Jatrophihabitans sp.]|uniref:alpha/beta hydrolase n=1 Tax=Jatrophihabitans sp. TaxID=1932789 RepID=UPI0030C73356|nr:Esterase/lipase/thioesterase [Jatrophihabitans sp.]